MSKRKTCEESNGEISVYPCNAFGSLSAVRARAEQISPLPSSPHYPCSSPAPRRSEFSPEAPCAVLPWRGAAEQPNRQHQSRHTTSAEGSMHEAEAAQSHCVVSRSKKPVTAITAGTARLAAMIDLTVGVSYGHLGSTLEKDQLDKRKAPLEGLMSV